jgi:hypothetical protein
VKREEWVADGVRRFGADRFTWPFVCPACGHVATATDWRRAGAPDSAIAFSCIGRWLAAKPRDAFEKGPGPCDYAGGGLIGLNPVEVDGGRYFAFAERTKNEDVEP